jgi:hypothetical protein
MPRTWISISKKKSPHVAANGNDHHNAPASGVEEKKSDWKETLK